MGGTDVEVRMPVKCAVVVDPYPSWSTAIGQVLSTSGVDVLGAARSLAEGAMLIEKSGPDLVVVDPAGQDGTLGPWLQAQRRRQPLLKTIVFSARRDADSISRALASGAAAYVVKQANPAVVRPVLRQLERRSIFFRDEGLPSTSPAGRAGEEMERAGLTGRQQEILCLVAEGSSNREIARALWVTEQTVKFHLSNIYRKLGVANRTRASRWAHDRGLLPVCARRPG